MLIRVNDIDLVDDLCVHYRRSGFHVEGVGGGMVEVARQDAPSREQERYEVLMHLRIWQVTHPETKCELLH